MKRGIIAAALTAGLLALGSGPASAQDLDCSAFARVQTYPGWGPALHYGEQVTVAFSASECSGEVADGAATYSLSGTATVYAGGEASGKPIAVEPFVSQGSFTDPDGSGWPPDWWSCDVEDATISWSIPGVYDFDAHASGGSWSLDVAAGGQSVHWAYSGC